MTPTRRPLLRVVALVLALLATPLVAPLATSYAADRPHTRDELVAHASGVTVALPFPVSGLEVGDDPTIPYAFASKSGFGEGNWRLRQPDGTSVRLPRLTWGAWAAVGDGAIGMAGTEAGPELQRVSGTGFVRSRMVEHFGLAVSPHHDIVGWLGDHGTVHVLEGGGTRHLTMPKLASGREIASVWGTDSCQEQAPEGGGCTVFVNTAHHVVITSSHGIVGRVGPMLQVSDVNQHGRVTGLVSRRTSRHRPCWGVFRADGHRVFRTCTYYLDSFSPDGREVLAERSQVRWDSVRRIAILARHGDVVRSWTFRAGPHRSLSQLTWEDSHHLLGVLQTHGYWGLVRIGTDGSVEYAGESGESGEFSPYDLPQR
jgi:hypothetical protein